MKREILFKSKRIDNGEWVEGKSLIQGTIEGREFCQIEHSDFNEYRQYECDIKTVCQFTGLLDKNGNKIFEGDELKNKFGNYVVEFADGCFHACNIDHEDNVPLYVHNEESEITGNIHDK